MSVEIPDEYEEKIDSVAESIISLNLDFIKDPEAFKKEFQQLLFSGLTDSRFRYLIQVLMNEAGEEIELNNPKEFISYLEEYLNDAGFYVDVDKFVGGGKVHLNSMQNNLMFFGLIVFLPFYLIFHFFRIFGQ